MSLPFALGLPALAVSLALALALGRGWGRQLGLALVGLAGWALFSAWSLVAGCPEDGECLPGLGAIFAAFALAGWLCGIALAPLVRPLLRRAPAG